MKGHNISKIQQGGCNNILPLYVLYTVISSIVILIVLTVVLLIMLIRKGS